MNPRTRDILFFECARWIGLLGVLHETIVEQGQRPMLIGLFGSMMGIRQLLFRPEPTITIEAKESQIIPNLPATPLPEIEA